MMQKAVKFFVILLGAAALSGCVTPQTQKSLDDLGRTLTSWPQEVFQIGRTKKTGSVRKGYDGTYDITFGTGHGIPLDDMVSYDSIQTNTKSRTEGAVIVRGTTSTCPNAQWIAHYKGKHAVVTPLPCQEDYTDNSISDNRYVVFQEPNNKADFFYAYDLKQDRLFKVDDQKEQPNAAKKKSSTTTAKRAASKPSKRSSTTATQPIETLKQVDTYKVGSVKLESVSTTQSSGTVEWGI